MKQTVRESLRIARARNVLRGLLGAVAIAAVLLVASGWLLAKRTTDSCGAALDVRDAMVRVLVNAQRRTNAAPAETEREQRRQQANEFYAQSIATLRAVDCTT